MNLPEFIAVTPEEVAVKGVGQELYHVGVDRKLALLLGLLQREEWTRALIFVNTKAGVEWLTAKLKGNGWPAEGITGDLPQTKRFRLMDSFKSGKSRSWWQRMWRHAASTWKISAMCSITTCPRTRKTMSTASAERQGPERPVGPCHWPATITSFTWSPWKSCLITKFPCLAEEDWYVEDKAGPVKTDRRRRDRKPVQNKARARVAGKKGGRPAGDRSGRARPARERPAMVHRHGEYTPQRTPGYCPGAFFGFTSEPIDSEAKQSQAKKTDAAELNQPELQQTAVAADDTTETPAETAAPAKKRRRPTPRRRRRSPAGGAKEARANGSGADGKKEAASTESKPETAAPETLPEG